MKAITETNFKLPGQTNKYVGKVRDIYTIDDEWLVMVATDRISAFDVVLPKGIPYKGQVLSQISAEQLAATSDIMPNWLQVVADPNVLIGKKCEVYKVEVIIRGYLVGSAWRAYKQGARELCGSPLEEGLKKNQQFTEPIITPTTKADAGHDENITPAEIISQGLMDKKEWEIVKGYAFKLFQRGTELAAKHGLLLVDTKYEFGKTKDGKIVLIDEVHTPDSSRFFYADNYRTQYSKGLEPRQLSKEFVREWLMERDFQGQKGQAIPAMTDDFVAEVSKRYQELYRQLTGKDLLKEAKYDNILKRVENNIIKHLEELRGKG